MQHPKIENDINLKNWNTRLYDDSYFDEWQKKLAGISHKYFLLPISTRNHEKKEKAEARRFLLASALGEIRRNLVSPWRNEPREKHIVDAAAVPLGPLPYPSCRITRRTLTGETNRLRTCCTRRYEKGPENPHPDANSHSVFSTGSREIGLQLMLTLSFWIRYFSRVHFHSLEFVFKRWIHFWEEWRTSTWGWCNAR